jgi:carboxylesterase type B
MTPDGTSNEHNLGPVHFDEIQYLFDSQFFGLKPLEGKDLEISKQLLTVWTNFAKFGEPTPKNDDIVKVNWEKVTKENFHYLDIGSDLVMKQNYLPERMKLWKNLYNKISKGQKINKDEL